MVSVIISYCNNDLQFIEESLTQVRKFSDDIQISYCTHTLDGKPETVSPIMLQLANEYGAKPIQCEYNPNKNAKYHHNLMRYVPTWKTKYDYILYLDADEIIEGKLFKEYLETGNHKEYDAICFKCYWYFRSVNNRADQTETAGVLVKKAVCCNIDYIFSNAERGEFANRKYLKCDYEFTYEGKILMHHYSWVRTKNQMIKKVNSWAHKDDKNWIELIEEEFSRDFNGTDFVHNYTYKKPV